MPREYPERPIVAVGGVTFRGEDVLLARRGKAPGYGTWTIPGGALKLGERLRDGVAREVKEECGIDVAVGDVVEVIDRLVRDDEGRIQYHYVIVDCLAVYTGGELVASSDCLEARWVPPAGLDGYDLTTAVKDTIAKARRMLAEHPLVAESSADGESATPGH